MTKARKMHGMTTSHRTAPCPQNPHPSDPVLLSHPASELSLGFPAHRHTSLLWPHAPLPWLCPALTPSVGGAERFPLAGLSGAAGLLCGGALCGKPSVLSLSHTPLCSSPFTTSSRRLTPSLLLLHKPVRLRTPSPTPTTLCFLFCLFSWSCVLLACSPPHFH